jgi:SRSO17 transposase
MVVEDNGGPGAVGAEQRSAFVDQVSDGLGRADQRRTARVYLRGLLDPQGGRGSPAAKSGVEHAASRALQQFITFLPWEWQPPRPANRRAHPPVSTVGALAPAVAVSTIPQRGPHSVGVRRRFASATGPTVDGQLAVGAFLATDAVQVPIDWELVLDGERAGDGERRNRTRIPGVDPAAIVVAAHA